MKITLTILTFFISVCTFGQNSRIAWDNSSLVRLMHGSYPRMIQLQDKSLIAVAGSGAGVCMTRSFDNGKTWSKSKIIVPRTEKVNMAVPEIMQCHDGSLLLTYNPRPNETNTDKNLKFGIRARKSTDNGTTWSNEIFVYDAESTWENGCWEPCTLQLPSGEIQLYFANENDYPNTKEQNISMSRSFDSGLSWSKPEIISFRGGHRDGMPVPVYLPASGEIVVVIEDNGYAGHLGLMQPSIVRTSLTDNWKSGFVAGDSPKRNYALAQQLSPQDNAGAPYLRLLPSQELVLSYQGTENRNVPIVRNRKTIDNSQDMFVAVGDKTGRNFTNKSTPFNLPLGPNNVWPADGKGYEALWNSLSVVNNDEVWAITSTNGINKPGVWGIKGYLMNDFKPLDQKIKVDGNEKDWDLSSRAPIFIGHKSSTNLQVRFAKDNEKLYVLAKIINDKTKIVGNSDIEKNDGVKLVFANNDADNSLILYLTADTKIYTKTNSTNNWIKADKKIFKTATNRNDENSYSIECAISLNYLKSMGFGIKIPLNVTLIDALSDKEVMIESVANCTEDKSTWMRIMME